MIYLIEYYRGKTILITGHTGFKGSWLCRLLTHLGAKVYGYALAPSTEVNLYDLLELDNSIRSKIGDIRDFNSLYDFYKTVNPDICIHMAAQPLVLEGYRNPRETYDVNVMGTVNVMECARLCKTRSVINVTTDKVYENHDLANPFRESDRLGGYDPYSNSKSCSEFVTQCYVRSYPEFYHAVSTVRAGNVIGGGDFAPDRIVPDCIRAVASGSKIIVRNPNSIRPYQHVLEPLYSYLYIAYEQDLDPRKAGAYNIGPDEGDCLTTGNLVQSFCDAWGENASWGTINADGPHEAEYLKLDNSLAKKTFNLSPIWDSSVAISKVVEWAKIWKCGGDLINVVDSQIKEYLIGRGLDV